MSALLPLLLLSTACEPAVELAGDAGLVERVRDELAVLGVRGPAHGCAADVVLLAREDGSVTLELSRADGRTERRLLRDEAGLAPVIESLLRPGVVLEVPAPVRAESPAPARPLVDALAPTVELAVDGGGSPGVALSLLAERRLGMASLIVNLRAGWTPSVAVGELPLSSRAEVEALAGIGRRFALDRVGIRPLLAAGLGWTAVQRASGSCAPSCGSIALDAARAASVRPRVAGGALVDASLSGSISAGVLVLADVTPLAAGARVPAWAASLPAPVAARLALPPDPHVTFRLGATLTWSPP